MCMLTMVENCFHSLFSQAVPWKKPEHEIQELRSPGRSRPRPCAAHWCSIGRCPEPPGRRGPGSMIREPIKVCWGLTITIDFSYRSMSILSVDRSMVHQQSTVFHIDLWLPALHDRGVHQPFVVFDFWSCWCHPDRCQYESHGCHPSMTIQGCSKAGYSWCQYWQHLIFPAVLPRGPLLIGN